MAKHRFGIVAAWLVATAAAVGTASLAVGLVADRVEEVPAQLPLAVIDATQTPAAPTSLVPGGDVSDSATTSTSRATTTTSLAPPATTIPTTTTTASPPVASGTTTATTSPPTTVAPTPTATSTTPPTTTQPVNLDQGTFVVVGGQVTAACTSPNAVALLGAIPAPGFTVSTEQSGPDKVKVEFESESVESEIQLRCRDGKLDVEISD